MDIKEKVKKLPYSPGVYLMKSGEGKVIYIGKATSLKKRVGSYFKDRPVSPRLAALIENIKDIEYILTSNEAQALLLEAALIKSRRPKYNIALRDDKNYPLLKLTLYEKYPRLLITRIKKNDGAMYFGPYTEAKLLRKALAFLRRAFPLRTCKALPKSLCLNFYLKQCLGPCVGGVSENKYKHILNQLMMFLEGRSPELLRQLQEEMEKAAKEKRYEEACKLRDQIGSFTQFSAGTKSGNETDRLIALREMLNLKKEPVIIEAFDVSNISGREAVGSMVTFKNGRPHKNGYRKFRIREVKGIDDYAMIKEIVRRRYQRLLEERQALPDLIVIDGGRGHLSSAKEELDRLGLSGLPVISIAKEFEHIFVPDRPEPIKLPGNSLVLYLIQRIRDEAHRFAIGYHSSLRGRLTEESILDSIKGIGPKKKTAIIKHFGSIEGIKRATKADLLQIKGVTEPLAREILQKVR
ncbi:MAG: excinuclease ABC subunit UvrC [Candidatus Omnitrophota bacterium]